MNEKQQMNKKMLTQMWTKEMICLVLHSWRKRRSSQKIRRERGLGSISCDTRGSASKQNLT
jgi:hypothetical protein